VGGAGHMKKREGVGWVDKKGVAMG
jgi:hypothetical protein